MKEFQFCGKARLTLETPVLPKATLEINMFQAGVRFPSLKIENVVERKQACGSEKKKTEQQTLGKVKLRKCWFSHKAGQWRLKESPCPVHLLDSRPVKNV